MSMQVFKKIWPAALMTLISITLSGPMHARSSIQLTPFQSNQIDVVIAMDVSSSMDGLIDSAKQRLWDIVNELGRAALPVETIFSVAPFRPVGRVN